MLTHFGAGVAGRVQLRPRCAKACEQFPRDALDCEDAVTFAIRGEPIQLAGVLANYLVRDALVCLVLEENLNAGLQGPVVFAST